MVKTAVVRVLPVQHPLLFRDVVFTDFSGMFENAIKKTLVDRDEEKWRKTERLLAQNLRDTGGDLVRLFLFVLVICPLGLRFVIGIDERLRLVQGNLALDVFLGDFEQIIRRSQAIDLLQADSRRPRVGLFPLGGFDLTDVFFKIQF